MLEKALLAICSAVAGSLLTYGANVLKIEGRLDGIERSVTRIEQRLFPPAN
mgnify:CR=1 FL=1